MTSASISCLTKWDIMYLPFRVAVSLKWDHSLKPLVCCLEDGPHTINDVSASGSAGLRNLSLFPTPAGSQPAYVTSYFLVLYPNFLTYLWLPCMQQPSEHVPGILSHHWVGLGQSSCSHWVWFLFYELRGTVASTLYDYEDFRQGRNGKDWDWCEYILGPL